MELIYRSVDELIPYEKNPRKNDKAVDKVAASIEEFGFKVPCVIDNNGVLITGHTRLKAAKLLGIREVPCIIADDLTEEQVKAFRLADNKVAEIATWDFKLLDGELDEILDIDMTQFDFKLKDDSDDFGYFGDAREKTYEAYNLDAFTPELSEGKWQMPILRPCHHIPESLIGFNYVLTSSDVESGVHFYVDDYQFERVWQRPYFYIDKIKKFDCSLTPDFSLYLDMPMAMKIWNVYRSRLIGQLMQQMGIEVIPTVSWAEAETHEFCFDGLPKHSVLSVSTIGVKQDKAATKIWNDGMDAMIERCEPEHLVVYGGKLDYDYGNIGVTYISNSVTDRMNKSRK